MLKNSKLFDSRQKKGFSLVVLLSFFFILGLNILTPLMADDFSYTFSRATGHPITGIPDIFFSQVNHYFTWGGRSVVHFLAQFFLLLGKPVFNVLNACVYILTTLLMYFMANGRKPVNIPLYISIHIALWLFNPVYGQTILWLVGSCNYLWGAAIILSLLLPVRLYMEREFSLPKLLIPLFLVMGVTAGWCNENTSGAAVLFVLIAIVYLKILKRKIPLWIFSALLGLITGFLFMILAPGNYTRMELFRDIRSLLHIYSARATVLTNHLAYGQWIIFFIVIVIALMIMRKISKTTIATAVILFFIAIACNYAMLLSVTIPDRSFMGTLCFLIITGGYCFSNLDQIALPNESLPKKLSVSISCFLCVLFFFSSFPALYDIGLVFVETRSREALILSEKQKGTLDITVPRITSESKYCALYGLGDFSANSQYWVNIEASRYYEVNSITAE